MLLSEQQQFAPLVLSHTGQNEVGHAFFPAALHQTWTVRIKGFKIQMAMGVDIGQFNLSQEMCGSR